MLQFDNRWRFDSPGPIEGDVETGFIDLINRVCGQGHRQTILEHFKSHFAAAAGVPHHVSSDASWAASDFEKVMSEAAQPGMTLDVPLDVEIGWGEHWGAAH